jgi:uncharacterized membrane protein
MIYILSFLILFCAEICSNIDSLFAVRNNKNGMAIAGAFSSALWCLKIVVIVNQPLTIISAFIGAYFGALMAFYIDKKVKFI